ncbi:uncharacterized protein TNCV_1711041 [Trichonephila clavipes]|nr:uncharacterized protein TNCV_1711041 [Trichonephila clavipes]
MVLGIRTRSGQNRTRSRHVMISSLVPLKTCRAEGMHVKSVGAQAPSGWCQRRLNPWARNSHDVQELWFQRDGATCHTARATINLLKDTFGDRLISRFGPVNWSPRSCDLTPLDYFLWAYVKSLVYADTPQALDHLEDNIRRVIADIYGHKCWKKSSKIGRPDWTTSEPAVAVLCQKSYLKIIFRLLSTRLSFE